MAASRVNCLSVSGILCVMILLSRGDNVRNSLKEDLLQPYPQSQRHGPSHSHRFVRDCQYVRFGNVTHETWRGSHDTGLPVAESKIFISAISSDFGKPRWVTGHMTFVKNPLRTFSVLEPGGPGGCESRRRETVEQTSRPKKCLFAQNGGYFNTKTGECLGNVVSDGTLVKDSKGVQNAQFGIRKDGTLVFGYLSEEDVLDKVNPFVQLVSGVVWLLRNGEPYINESMAAECEETQETGHFHRFVNAMSARTAVGHDAGGRVILFHIDGQTEIRGMNLWEVADFLKKQGVINAINLDGGGSSTYVVNGSLASYPSDHSARDNMWRVARNVSTVLCVHEPWCEPEDCSGHGECVEGECVCHAGWRGPTCSNLTCQAPSCGDHGLCSQYGCICDAGWKGSNCSEECEPGFYGDGCNQTCACLNGGVCDSVHGGCTCPAGFHGVSCEQACPVGFYGLSCEQECRCQDMCPCDPVTGACNITYTWKVNSSMHRAGHCLATRMFKSWKEEETAHKPRSYFAESTWMVITSVLSTLLLASTVCNLIQRSRSSGALLHKNDYSYVPLTEVNRRLSLEDLTEPASLMNNGKGRLQQNDSDSQDSS
ncbi:N-acetylglucosamine-1-phosphodiester alpha-N-acetylglucosaminidase [Megalops cyprinoides]|uniref:N-acetylglucosamine-1-phosphodiester alpha-N-acetylglucosaminidase n=1 Tax=Megalops cyprinoides TaxID=118141 RepID=UPI001864AD80|nr:N-acetylglucosamine-1-phosphodiester alpha-N-acetylglucosaminidase [Megalops cyprinoides]